jgi:GAF domain-containing protein
MPLIVAGKPVGVLNRYACTPNAFGPRERQLAALLAGQATIAVTAALRHYDEVTLSDQLRIAVSSRAGQTHQPRRARAAAGVLSVPSVGDSQGPLVVVNSDMVGPSAAQTAMPG